MSLSNLLHTSAGISRPFFFKFAMGHHYHLRNLRKLLLYEVSRAGGNESCGDDADGRSRLSTGERRVAATDGAGLASATLDGQANCVLGSDPRACERHRPAIPPIKVTAPFRNGAASEKHTNGAAVVSGGAIYGALDLGTNNCRLLVARPSRRGFFVIDAFSRIIKLGEGVSQSRRVNVMLIEESPPGACVLVHVNNAMRLLDEEEASLINEALDELARALDRHVSASPQ